MPLTELNHYFIRANELEKTKDFYCDVLGFQVMPRPTFPFPGSLLIFITTESEPPTAGMFRCELGKARGLRNVLLTD